MTKTLPYTASSEDSVDVRVIVPAVTLARQVYTPRLSNDVAVILSRADTSCSNEPESGEGHREGQVEKTE